LPVRGPVWDLATDDAGTLVAAASRTLLLFEADAGSGRLRRLGSFELPHSEKHDAQSFQAVRLSADGTWVAAGDDAGRFMLFDREEQRLVFVGDDQEPTMFAGQWYPSLPRFLQRRFGGLGFYPNGLRALTAGLSTTIKSWALTHADPVQEFRLG